MGDEWRWIWDPNAPAVINGLPDHVVGEVERLAWQLVELGSDAASAGRGRPEGGGIRTLDIYGGRGFFCYFTVEHLRWIAIVRITWIG